MLSSRIPQFGRLCSLAARTATAAAARANYATSCASDSFRLKEFSEKYLHNRQVEFTETLQFTHPESIPVIPIYRVTDSEGNIVDPSQDPNLDKETALKIYHTMTQLNTMDKVLYDSQRQGRISFYMTNFGEEGCHLGSAAALEFEDLIYGQYREVGVLMWRGFGVDRIVNQCYGNAKDLIKGKQMPIHYGSDDTNFVMISSPLATQLPQSVGSAYAYKLAKNGRVVVCYLGDGSASEGDTHSAFNSAATLKCPVIFFVRNNGYAISTPANEQYGGDGVAGKGPGYGLHTIRVDGNDVLACYNAVKAARKLALENKPVLIEAMTYRVSHHSTSDDSTAYRSAEEVKMWEEKENPLKRFRTYLQLKGWWNEKEEADRIKETRKYVLKSFLEAEKVKKMHPSEMFEEVYKEMPQNIRYQQKAFMEHLKEYGQHYPLETFEDAPRK